MQKKIALNLDYYLVLCTHVYSSRTCRNVCLSLRLWNWTITEDSKRRIENEIADTEAVGLRNIYGRSAGDDIAWQPSRIYWNGYCVKLYEIVDSVCFRRSNRHARVNLAQYYLWFNKLYCASLQPCAWEGELVLNVECDNQKNTEFRLNN